MKTCSKCGQTYDPAFVICECGARLPDQAVSDVVAAWLEGEETMFDTVYDSPEVAWQAILEILTKDLTDDQMASLAAGPMEDLLAQHGPKFIERVEHEAKQNERFHRLLRDVSQNEMSPKIWKRVQKARSKHSQASK
jgi:hypothetical protein